MLGVRILFPHFRSLNRHFSLSFPRRLPFSSPSSPHSLSSSLELSFFSFQCVCSSFVSLFAFFFASLCLLLSRSVSSSFQQRILSNRHPTSFLFFYPLFSSDNLLLFFFFFFFSSSSATTYIIFSTVLHHHHRQLNLLLVFFGRRPKFWDIFGLCFSSAGCLSLITSITIFITIFICSSCLSFLLFFHNFFSIFCNLPPFHMYTNSLDPFDAFPAFLISFRLLFLSSIVFSSLSTNCVFFLNFDTLDLKFARISTFVLAVLNLFIVSFKHLLSLNCARLCFFSSFPDLSH